MTASERNIGLGGVEERDDEKFRLFADATEEGIVIHDYEKVLAANSYFGRMFGYAEDAIVGAHPFSFIAVKERAEVEAAASRDKETSGETLGLRADGSVFPMLIVARTVPYQGRSVRVVRVRDLTERRKTEASLYASEERFRATFEQAAVGIAHVATDGSFLRVNRRLCEITGYDHEDLAKLTFQDITHPEDLNADLELFSRLMARTLDRYSMEKRYFRKDGKVVWVNLTVAMIGEANGHPAYFISVIEDISERKAMEETLRQTQKMDVVGQLTSSIAHDFGNFLNIIKGNLQLLQVNPRDKKGGEYINSALAGAELAETLIRQLLSFSRRQEPEVEATDVNLLISNVSGLLRRAVTGPATLAVDYGTGPCVAICDKGQLETALLNLVLNARDALGGKGGSIRISTSMARCEQGQVDHDGDFVRIEVSDDGHGMAPDVVAHACDPFFTTKSRGGGTGLGLSQVARCLAQVNGFLDIDSTEDVVSKVALFLPAAPTPIP